MKPIQNFSVSTPRDHYVFQASHQIAKLEWIKSIKKCMVLSGNKSSRELLENIPITDQYLYTKSLEGRLSLVITSTPLRQVKTVIKLKKSGPWTIGRSHDNDIRLSDPENFFIPNPL